MEQQELTPRQRFEQELAPIGFDELQKHFAKGLLIKVAEPLNIIDVAVEIHADNATQVENWVNEAALIRAHDEHARQWLASRTRFNAVTVAPWVLVQELEEVK